MNSRRKVANKRSPYYTPAVADATFTIGAEASNVITVAVQLKDANGVALAVRAKVDWYLSSDATGDTFASAASGGVVNGTNGQAIAFVTGKCGIAVTEANGTLDIAVTDTTVRNVYLNIVLPDGTLKTSAVLGFL